MLNPCRWLWRNITESVILKSALIKVKAIFIEINDSSTKVAKNVVFTPKNVSYAKVNRRFMVSKVATPIARLRADLSIIKELIIYKIYNATTAPAKLCEFIRTQTVKRVSDLIMCLAYLTSYKNYIIPINIVNGIKADTVEIETTERATWVSLYVFADPSDTVNVNINLTKPIDTYRAKMEYWIYPILEDGVLTILQSCDAVQTGDILEVI